MPRKRSGSFRFPSRLGVLTLIALTLFSGRTDTQPVEKPTHSLRIGLMITPKGLDDKTDKPMKESR